MRRPPATLWRTIFVDLASLTVLTSAVLVVVTALGATVQPLTGGKLSPGDVLLFASLACVPMLAYALPFAAGFASTLVYHRLAADNEATAAHAGGISHRSLLVPAAAMGVVLAICLGLLNEQVIPAFLQQMQRLITNDIAKILVNDVERGRPAMIGTSQDRTIIYADRAERIKPDPASGAVDQVLFTKFVVIQLDRDRRPVQELTAARATLSLYPGNILGDKADDAGRLSRDDDTFVAVIRLEDALGADAGAIGGFREETTFAFRVPNIFRDNPKFLSYGRLRRLTNFPEDINWIDADRRSLASAMGRVGLMDSIAQALAGAGAVTLLDADNRPVIIRAAGLIKDGTSSRLLPTGDRGVVFVSHARAGTDGDVARESIAADAVLTVGDPSENPGRVPLSLELRRARTREVSSGRDFSAYPELSVYMLHGLHPQASFLDPYLSQSAPQLLQTVATSPAGVREDPIVAKKATDLAKNIAQVRRDVLAKSNERMAMAVSCFVMVITGATAALRLSRSMPLTIYLWTFFPALSCIITIAGGQQMTRTVGAPGLIMLWGGVGALAVYTLIVFRNLAKH